MSGTAPRVLLVEDHPGFARLIELTVGDALGTDVELVLAGDWAQAGRALSAGGVTCVLLDLTLPDEAGPHLVDLVTRAAPGVAVIVLSGRDSPGLEADLLARGARAFVHKDDAATALVPALRAALAGGRRDPITG